MSFLHARVLCHYQRRLSRVGKEVTKLVHSVEVTVRSNETPWTHPLCVAVSLTDCGPVYCGFSLHANLLILAIIIARSHGHQQPLHAAGSFTTEHLQTLEEIAEILVHAHM